MKSGCFGRGTAPRYLAVVIVALLGASVFLTACGGGGGSSSESTASSSSEEETEPGGTEAGGSEDKGLAEAEELVAKFSTLPTSIGEMEPIEKPIENGKTIAFINSGTPAVEANLPHLKAAAAALGWKVTDVPAGTTAAENSAAWDRVLQLKPDFVQNTSGFTTASFAKQCKEMTAAGIAVFDNSVPREDAVGYGDCVKGMINDETQIALTGKIAAAYVVAHSEGKGNAVVLNVPEIPILTAFTNGFEEGMASMCPSCGVDTLDLLIADLGTQEIPTKTVGYLRANPDTDYVAASYDDLLSALPTALQGAGLEDVTLLGETPQVGNMVEIERGGAQKASVIYDQIQANWKSVDMMARYSNGESLEATEKAEDPFFLATSENVEVWPEPAEKFPWPTVTDYEEQYKELWGVK